MKNHIFQNICYCNNSDQDAYSDYVPDNAYFMPNIPHNREHGEWHHVTHRTTKRRPRWQLRWDTTTSKIGSATLTQWTY